MTYIKYLNKNSKYKAITSYSCESFVNRERERKKTREREKERGREKEIESERERK